MKIIKENLSSIKVINVVLRIFAMGSKFLVFTIMSKYFSNEVFGEYSLITTLITILIFALGLDFYNYSIRDIVSTENPIYIRNKVATSVVFFFFIYIIFTLISLFALPFVSYLKPIVLIFIGLAITEHFSQEIYRMLVGFKKVLFANILLFARTLSWVLVIIAFLYFNIPISLKKLFLIWLIANVATILYVFVYMVVKHRMHFRKIRIDISWIKTGLKVCFVFLIATISLKSIEYANRFIIDYYLGKEMVGVFTFYSNIAILMTLYINTIVISFELPDLISHAKNKQIVNLLSKFKRSLLFHIVFVTIGILVVIKPVLYWQDKVLFETYLPLLLFMLLSVGFMNYSLYHHFKLYIFHKDKVILKVMVIAGIISLLLTVVLTRFFGVYGSAIAFLLSGIIMFIFRRKEADKIIVNYD